MERELCYNDHGSRGSFGCSDGAFDFDGDGRLGTVESSTKFDLFFGDDE